MNIFFIIVGVISFIYILNELRKNTFNIVESIFWLCGSLIILILSIIPKIIDNIAMFLNISYPPSLLFLVCIVFLIFMNFRTSKLLLSQNEKIIALAQEIALIKQKK